MRQLTFQSTNANASWIVDRDCRVVAATAILAGAFSKNPTDAYTNYSSPTANQVVDSFVILLGAGQWFYGLMLPADVQLLKGEIVVFSTAGINKNSASLWIDP